MRAAIRTCVVSGVSTLFLFLVGVLSAAEPRLPTEPADTSSPRATLNSFLDSCNDLHRIIRSGKHVDRTSEQHAATVKRILDCLDASDLPDFAREHVVGEAAVCLKEVLDRVPLPPDNEIPDLEAVQAADGDREFVSWRVPRTRIVIARVEQGPRRGEYLFTADVVAHAAEYYEDMKSFPYRTEGRSVSAGLHDWYLSEPGRPAIAALVHRLPDVFSHRAGGQAVWQWIGLTLAIPIAMLLMFAVYRIEKIRAAHMKKKSAFRYCVTFSFLLVAIPIPLFFRNFVEYYLTIRGNLLYALTFSADMIFLATLLVVILGAGSRVAEVIIASPRINPKGLDAQLVRIVCRVVGMGIAMIVFLEGGSYLGIPLTTLVTSAGVGGLTLALAAQGTLKALFGTVMILFDKPYRVGERIIVRGHDGVIEEIGLRSTKLRLLTGHMLCIPNDEMAGSEIENIGRRPHIRRLTDLHIPLDTPRKSVENAVALIRTTLEDHEGMNPELPPRVFFNDFNNDSFNIRIIYWFGPPDYWKFLAFCERVNLEIFRVFEEEGISFSLPYRVAHTDVAGPRAPLDVRMVGEK